MKKKTFKNILALLLSILLSLIIAELVFRYYYYSKGLIPAIDDNEQCKINFYEQHKELLLDDELIDLGTSNFVPHPLYGWTLKPNFESILLQKMTFINGTYMNVHNYLTKINSQGMRAIKNYDVTKSNNILRIAALGDSFTYGIDVSLFFSYPAILERITENTEVLNFGVEAIGIDHMYLRFKNEVLNYKPDVLFMGILIDDIQRAALDCSIWLKPKIVIEDGQLQITNVPVPTPIEFMKNYKVPKPKSYFLKHILYKINSFNYDERKYETGFELLKYFLNDMKSTSQKENIFFMVGVISTKVETDLEKTYKQKLIQYLNDNEIPFVDSAKVFEEAANGFYKDQSFFRSSHFNDIGNALFAQEIKSVLENHKIITKDEEYFFLYNRYGNIDIMTLLNKENEQVVAYIKSFIPIED